jgi:hypothetical protein
MIKRLLVVLALVQISVQAFAICIEDLKGDWVCTPQLNILFPAKEARDIIMNTIYRQHSTAIDWWVKEINTKIKQESKRQSASTLINVTAASNEVQEYLTMAYEREGYNSELMPDWDRKQSHENPPKFTRMYLGLSW